MVLLGKREENAQNSCEQFIFYLTKKRISLKNISFLKRTLSNVDNFSVTRVHLGQIFDFRKFSELLEQIYKKNL